MLGLSAVHEREHQHHRAELDAEEARGQHHVRRADDADVEAVGVVPPVVEGRRRQHGHAAPRADERAKRTRESPDPDADVLQARRSARRSW